MKIMYQVHSKLWDEAVFYHLFYRAALSHATLSTAQRALMMSEPDDWSEWDRLCCLMSGSKTEAQLHNSQNFIFLSKQIVKARVFNHFLVSTLFLDFLLESNWNRFELRDAGVMPLACESSGFDRCCGFKTILKMTEYSFKIFFCTTHQHWMFIPVLMQGEASGKDTRWT